jgi:predicted transcriptional regulator
MAKPKPDAEKKGATISARVTDAEFATLQQIAQDDDRTVSYIVAKAVREFLDRNAHRQKRR